MIPLFPLAGKQGDQGAKERAAAAKEAVRFAERINGALKSACRVESVLVPQDLGLNSPTTGKGKSHSAAWSVIRSTTNLRWILLTSRPESVASALPSDWIGKGYQNVCIGAVLDDPARLAEARKHLAGVRCRYRMLLLRRPPSVSELEQNLDGIHWVVADDRDHPAHLRAVCQSAEVAFLSLPRDLPTPDFADEVNLEEGRAGPVSLEHPFGSDVQLRRPTLQGLRKDDPVALSWDIKPAAPVPSSPAAETAEVAATPLPNAPANPDEESPETPSISCNSEADEEATFELLPTVPDDGSPAISDNDRSDFARLDHTVRRGVAAFRECGEALAEIHDRKLWKAGKHASWESYVREVLGMSKPHAHRLVQAARITSELSEALPVGNDLPRLVPASESQVRPLCRLKSQEMRTSAWALAVQRAEGQPTAKQISEVVAELMAEEPGPAGSTRVPRKHRIREVFRKLRSSITRQLPTDQIQGVLDELEALLKLT
jgi:hypothetical protein